MMSPPQDLHFISPYDFQDRLILECYDRRLDELVIFINCGQWTKLESKVFCLKRRSHSAVEVTIVSKRGISSRCRVD